MQVWNQIRRVFRDPPPAFAFEVSQDGIAFSRQGKQPDSGVVPLDAGVLNISPLSDNVTAPEAFFQTVKSLAPRNGKNWRRTTALILPDYCARVAVLDFDEFPSKEAEQTPLVQFRMKKGIPFELESARVSYYTQPAVSGSKKIEVVAAVVALEIVARYEAAFRQAGFVTGHVTTSTLAALNLLEEDGIQVLAKTGGGVLTTAVTEGRRLRLLRCVQLPGTNASDVLAILYPTFAYIEDKLGERPKDLVLCGFGDSEEFHAVCREELGVNVQPLRSRLGAPDGNNAGLLGFLQAVGD